MKINRVSFFRKALSDLSGQSAVWVALSLTAMMGLAGLSIDAGHAYVVYSQLQIAANAAALSGASSAALYNSGSNSAKTVATTYSGLNPVNGAGVPVVTTPCLNFLMSGHTGCTNDSSGNANGTSAANAVRVTETATVPMYFMKIFGVKSITMKATATAANATSQPWNVAIILDATGSMGNIDSYCTTSNTTAEQCAMNGIQTMLKSLNPCLGGVTNCKADTSDAKVRVSFFSFPNVSTSDVAYDYTCGGTPTSQDYSLPVIPDSTTTDGYNPFTYTNSVTTGMGKNQKTTKTTWTSTYQITTPNAGNADKYGFLSDYYSSSSSLNSSSILVKAIGNGNTKGCMAVPSDSFAGTGRVGGETYFAGAIYAAQTALQAEQAQVTKLGITSNNAIIFISDGQAGANNGAFPPVTSTADDTTDGISVTYAGSSSKNMTGANNTFGIYPDYNDQCQQAIAAAQYVRNLGTRFYAVAYGTESSGCGSNNSGTDSTKVVTGTLNVSFTDATKLKPCTALENMASPVGNLSGLWYFYTDGSSVANGCSDTSHTSNNLSSIFGAIAATFKNARLISNNVT
jgi:Flp pilus assembly protein TadG